MPSAEKSSHNFDNLWMPFSYYRDTLENPPIVIEKGEGAWITDKQGKRYLDAVGSWWVSILGHNHPYITDAVRRQLDKIEHVIMAGFISEPALRLSEMLKSILPSELTRIFYSDDGSTAVEIALKIALQYHSLRGETRPLFVSFDGGYHGDTLGAMSVGMIPQYHALFHQQFKKQLFAHSPYCYRCPVNCTPEHCHSECMDSLEKILQEHNQNIAACILNRWFRVQSECGYILQRYLNAYSHYASSTTFSPLPMKLQWVLVAPVNYSPANMPVKCLI
jgi:adenosylmethionine-8-amino-7-oxononanoate aminotransferase